jgi:hypothetical protein
MISSDVVGDNVVVLMSIIPAHGILENAEAATEDGVVVLLLLLLQANGDDDDEAHLDKAPPPLPSLVGVLLLF